MDPLKQQKTDIKNPWGRLSLDPAVVDLPLTPASAAVTQETQANNEAQAQIVAVNKLDPPPLIAPPLFGGSDKLSMAWTMWFLQLYRRVGGAVSGTVEDATLLSVYDGSASTIANADSAKTSDFNFDYESHPSVPSHEDIESLSLLAAAEPVLPIQHLVNMADHPFFGCIVQPTYANNGNGTFTLGDNGEYAVCSEPTGRKLPESYRILGGTFTPVDKTTNYLVADYNGGIPTLRLTTIVSAIDEIMIVPVRTIYRNGNVLHQLDWDTLGLALANKLNQSIVKTDRFRREDGGGLAIGEAATRRVTVAAGVIWYGGTSLINAAYSSLTDKLVLYYHSAGVWAETTITQYNNSQYDDGTNLQALTGSHYAVNFVYRLVNSAEKQCFIVLGQGNYSIGDAQMAQPPANIPGEISAMSVLVGRIIVENGATVATQIDSAFAQQFAASPATNHNDLAGLQGGSATEYYHNTASEYLKLQAVVPHSITKESTGFVEPESVIVTYDATARTVTLTGTVTAYYQGVIVPLLVSGWVSAAHDATVGPWFLYWNGSAFVWQVTLWTFDQLQISYVSYGAVSKFAIRETHGLMQWQCHKEFHETLGTYRTSGGDISSIVTGSTTAANRRPAISATVLSDEDLVSTLPLKAASSYTRMSLSGTSTDPVFALAAADIVSLSGNNPYWNSYTAPNWGQTLMTNNSYMALWLMAIPASADATSQAFRYVWIQGQHNDNALSKIQALTFADLNIGNLKNIATEFIAITKVIIQYTAANWVVTSVENLTGTKISSGSNPGGQFLTTVVTAAPVTGAGTTASPVTMAAATATVPGYVSVGTQVFGGQKQLNNTTASQSLFYGYTTVASSARADSGSITFGNNVAYQGLIDYSGIGSTIFAIKNTYADAGARINLITNGINSISVGPSTIGFWGTTPATKQTVTGSRGGNAALASFLTALANYGFITDSTTA